MLDAEDVNYDRLVAPTVSRSCVNRLLTMRGLATDIGGAECRLVATYLPRYDWCSGWAGEGQLIDVSAA